MRGYRTSAGTETRLDYGLELAAGLQLFSETAPLAPGFEATNAGLEAAHTTRRAKRAPRVTARVALRLANYEMDQTIRSCGKAAEIADGGRRGAVFNVLFPQGVGPVVAPAGAQQIKPTEDLLSRMTKSKNAAVMAFAKEWQPKLEASLQKLRDAATVHSDARKAYLDAFKDEIALREEHKDAVDRLMGQVRAAFPRDRVKQDLVFPVMDEESGSGAEESPEAPEAAPEAVAPIAVKPA